MKFQLMGRAEVTKFTSLNVPALSTGSSQPVRDKYAYALRQSSSARIRPIEPPLMNSNTKAVVRKLVGLIGDLVGGAYNFAEELNARFELIAQDTKDVVDQDEVELKNVVSNLAAAFATSSTGRMKPLMQLEPKIRECLTDLGYPIKDLYDDRIEASYMGRGKKSYSQLQMDTDWKAKLAEKNAAISSEWARHETD